MYPLIERLLTHFETAIQLKQHLGNILAWLRDRTANQTDYAAVNLQKPGFLRKYCVVVGRIGKKPGFFVGVRPGLIKCDRTHILHHSQEQARCLFHKR